MSEQPNAIPLAKMSDINAALFIKDEKPGEYQVTFRIGGTVHHTIKAESKQEARAKAEAMMEDEEFGLELDDADDMSISYISERPAMFLITRDGRPMKTSRLQPGDTPRDRDEYGF